MTDPELEEKKERHDEDRCDCGQAKNRKKKKGNNKGKGYRVGGDPHDPDHPRNRTQIWIEKDDRVVFFNDRLENKKEESIDKLLLSGKNI